MIELKKPVELLLASTSPRRRQIVSLLGMPCTFAVASADEDAAQATYPGSVEGLAEWSARYKASVALALPEAEGRLVITADTTVILENVVLNKPRDNAHALEMLQALRARWHHVITGVAVSAVVEGKVVMHSTSCLTPVLMRNYSDAELAAYIASGDPLDKAGAYGIQNPTFLPTAKIDGCYANVVGLPLCTVADLMAEFGIYPSRKHMREDSACPWSEKCLI